ncbi:hypothetical protein AOXY_G26640 [Acipenser oxyrinchus oxyrinchus]|uniref:Fibronectin type-III domain-containing protein n=1 Tax=Acipenser oxyrinchus oxyrinchus TaxID=40147 RepID=A0AAD8CQE2_ACIOX|nr:hypothetical protein AOXY_G26640 [Acipenser oxyrinchus oxyrinchus]
MVLEWCGVLRGLLSQDPGQVMGVVEALVWELHQDKEGLIESLLRDPSSQDYMRALCRLLTSTETRLCSNAAYILGSIAESETGTQQLVSLGGAGDLLGTLTALLSWDDAEAVMNAAGTIGTLAESSEGRRWILGERGFVEMVDSVIALLDARSEWTVSNAALVLARLSMCESGCRRLLEHPSSSRIISKLIASLRGDEAGCGMNAAFALGRLCDTDSGLQRILSMAEAPGMVVSLGAMLAQPDTGGSKNACFALSCLATEAEGHAHVLQSPAFPQLLNSLYCLLQAEDQDSAWFAAMTVKVLASQPSGVLKLREHRKLEDLLKSLVCSKTAGKELLEEVSLTLTKLQRLPRPLPPRTELLDSGSVLVSWETCTPGSGLEVTYSLFDGSCLLYSGLQSRFTLTEIPPGQAFLFRLRLSTPGDDTSPYSEAVRWAVQKETSLPGSPQDLRVIGCTQTQVKLSWAPPADPQGPLKGYQLFRGETLLDTTTELSCIAGGLSPSSLYEFGVCALGSTGRGAMARVEVRTADPGDHAPSKLAVTVLGRHEISVSWDIPEVPLGRLFNFELCINGRVVYLGTERSYTARRLAANTEYTCTVSVITSEGRCESRPVTKRTARDEYENTAKCLYSPARASQQQQQQQQPPLPPPAKELPDCSDRTKKPRGTGAPHKDPPRAPKAHLALSKGCCKVWDSDSTGGFGARHSRRPSTRSQRRDGSESSAQSVEAVPKTIPTGRPQQSDQRGLSPLSSGTDPCARERGGGHGPNMRREPCTKVALNTVSDYDVGKPLFSRVQPREGVTPPPIRLPGKPPSSSSSCSSCSPAERPRGRAAVLLERRAKTESELLPWRGGRRREEQAQQEGAAGRRGSWLLEDSLQGIQSLTAVYIPGKESPFQLKHFQRGEAHTQLLSTKERLLSSDLLLRMNCVMQESSQQRRRAQSLSLSAGGRGPQLTTNHRTSRPPLPRAPPGLSSLLQDKASLVKRMQTLSEVDRIQLDWTQHHRTPVRLPARLGQGRSFVLTPATGVGGHCPKPR